MHQYDPLVSFLREVGTEMKQVMLCEHFFETPGRTVALVEGQMRSNHLVPLVNVLREAVSETGVNFGDDLFKLVDAVYNYCKAVYIFQRTF